MKKTSNGRSTAKPKKQPAKSTKATKATKAKKAKKPIHPGLLFLKNRGAQTYETLQPYAGKVVAWAQDGSCVVDFDDDVGVLIDRLDAKGLPSQDYCYERI